MSEQSWLLLLIDVSVKSLFLAAVAWVMLAMLRVKNSNVRHRVWSAVLCAMLLLPLLVPVTPTIPLPGWLIPDFPSAETQVSDTTPVTQLVEEPISASNIVAESSIASPDAVATWQVIELAESTDVVAPVEDLPIELPKHEADQSRTLPWPKLLAWSYLAIVGCFMLRILAGVWCMDRLVARSSRVTTANPLASNTVANAANLYESDELRVPLTVGFFRPKVLLPNEWREWSQTKLESVLAHETAHIRRGDYLVSLLAEINRAIHWFHPLAWTLRRWLSELAEQNCDDAVIASTGERTQYARHLLEVAGSLSEREESRVAWSGVAMARRPNVETRIDAILDHKRPLARRLSLIGAMLLMLIAIPAVFLAAALRPAEAPAEQNAATAAGVAAEADDSAETQDAFDEASKGQDDFVPFRTPAIHESDQTVAQAENEVVPTRIHGKAVDAKGNGVKAKVHVLSAFQQGMMKPDLEKIIHTFETDANGRFDVKYDMPKRNDKIDMGGGPGARVEKLVAIADGYGPAVHDVLGVRRGKEVKLTLRRDDVPIEGRILNLEGEPVVGATLRVATLGSQREDLIEKVLGDLRVRAGEKPQPMMLGSFVMSEAWDDTDDERRFGNERIYGNQLQYSKLVQEAKTDSSGRFRLDGLGRDRVIALELSGPGIVTSWISVVSRDMKPIGKTMFIGNRTDMTYGAKFTFSAEPSQIIRGVVTDVDTGKPIPNIVIETSAQEVFGRAKTNAKGEYSLTGLPRGRHRVNVVTPTDAPYFTQQFVDLGESPDGLRPFNKDFQLKRAVWISGSVKDKVTGEPVSARVTFLPHLDSEAAKAYSFREGMYVDPIRLPQGTATDANGNFRVRAVAGEGLLAAICDDYGFCKTDPSSLGDKWLTIEQPGRPAMTRTYYQMMWGWTHAMKPLSVDATSNANVDVVVDPGNTLDVKLVDADGKPVSGVLVQKRFPFSWKPEPPSDSSTVKLLAVSPEQPRAVFFLQRERNLSAFLHANQADRSGERTITMEKCGVVKGRLLTKDGKPITNVVVGTKPGVIKKESHETIMRHGRTDNEGKFEIQHFTPSTKFTIYSPFAGPKPEVIAGNVEIAPGEERDLGDVTLTETQPLPPPNNTFAVPSEDGTFGSLTVEPDDSETETKEPEKEPETEQAVVIAAPVGFAVGPGADQAALFSPKNDDEGDKHASKKPFVYEGQVQLPNGKPASGADIYFSYWQRTARRELPNEPVAKTDRDGRFRFERAWSSMDRESKSGIIVAKLNGHGFAMSMSPLYEQSGQLKRNQLFADHPEIQQRMEQMRKHDSGPLRLQEDTKTVRGKLVDLEGNGVAGARVSVTEVWSDISRDPNAWENAIKKPKIDFGSMQNLFMRQLRGPNVAAIFGSVKTTDDGSFEIGGLGEHRLVKLTIRGQNIEATSLWLRTDGGKKLKLPFLSSDVGGPDPDRSVTYYGTQFTHVTTPSRAIVGRVTDKETGEPIAGAVINSSLGWSSDFVGGKVVSYMSGNDESWATTGKNGNYRLDGLPRSKRISIRALGEKPYLHKSANVDTGGNDLTPAKKDFQLERGMTIEGQVIDANTGKGVEGQIQFATHSSPGRVHSWHAPGTTRTGSDGRFRITVPKKDGQVCFNAFDGLKYERKPLAEVNEGDEKMAAPATPAAGAIVSFMVNKPSYHAFASVKADAERAPVQLSVKPKTVVTGYAVSPEGKRVTNLSYFGQAQGAGWNKTVSGKLKLYGVKPGIQFGVVVVTEQGDLAGYTVFEDLQDGFAVKLKPSASIKGRLVDTEGEPIENVHIQSGDVFKQSYYDYFSANPNMAEQKKEPTDPPLPFPPVKGNRSTTDENGSFELRGLVADVAHTLQGSYQPSPTDYVSNNIAKLTLKPGEAKDLGKLVLKKMTKEEMEKQSKAARPFTFFIEE